MGIFRHLNDANLELLLSRKGRFELFFQYDKQDFNFEESIKKLKITDHYFFLDVLLRTRVLEYPEKRERFLKFIGFFLKLPRQRKLKFGIFNFRDIIRSDWFPLLILCAKENIISKEKLRCYIPYVDFLIKKIQNLSIRKIKNLDYYNEEANFERRFKYHNERIYPDLTMRKLMEDIRDNDNRIIISDKMDYPSYLWATNHEWQEYVPKVLNYHFKHIHDYENIDSYLVIESITYSLERIIIRYKHGRFAESIVNLDWEVINKLRRYTQYLKTCVKCHTMIPFEKGRIFNEYDYICNYCYKKNEYRQCSHCLLHFPKEELSKFERSGFIFCSECMENARKGKIEISRKIIVDLRKPTEKRCKCGRKGYTYYWVYWLDYSNYKRKKERQDFFCFYCKKSNLNIVHNIEIEYKKN